MKVTVIYNGIPHEVEVAKRSYGGALLDISRVSFAPSRSIGALGLFTKSGAELNGNQTLAAQGVRDGDELLMRPLVIR